MRGALKITGLNAVRNMLRSVGTGVPDTARGQMKRSADRIVKRARLYVPEDEGSLKNSIRIEKTYGDRGRLEIDIVVGDMTVIKYGKRIVDLNQYAAIIHERYEAMNPGKNTLRKRSANPGIYIGEGFLTRAAEEEEAPLQRNIVEAVTNIIHRGSIGR